MYLHTLFGYKVHFFLAVQMHSSNGNGYTFMIISYGLKLESKNDKLFIRLSQAVFIILPVLNPNVESMGQSPQLIG